MLIPRRVLRSPLTWMVSAEVCVVVCLCGFAWHVWIANQAALGRVAASMPAFVAAPPPSPSFFPGVTAKPARRSLAPPALNTDPSFWIQQLGNMEQDQVALERLEETLLKRIEQAARDYIVKVVIPVVIRAEKGP